MIVEEKVFTVNDEVVIAGVESNRAQETEEARTLGKTKIKIADDGKVKFISTSDDGHRTYIYSSLSFVSHPEIRDWITDMYDEYNIN